MGCRLGGFEGHSGDHSHKSEAKTEERTEPLDPAVLAVLNFSVTHENRFPFLFKSVWVCLQALAPCVASGWWLPV